MIVSNLRVASASASSQLQKVAVRCFSASIPYPKTPYRKQLLQRKREDPMTRWPTFNAPSLINKYIRHADRVSAELGVASELADFNEKAAAFASPPHIRVVTVLERPNVVLRDVEDWENDFIELSWQRKQAGAKRYPQTLIDMITASSTVVEGGEDAGGDNFSNIGASSTGEVPALSKPADKGSKKAAAASDATPSSDAAKGQGLSNFYEKGSSSKSASSSDSSGVMTEASRESMADKINDVRSLDRAYAQRLVMLVQNKDTKSWELPSGLAREGEKLKAAAERTLRHHLLSDASLDLWYVGNAPIGHLLHVYTPEEQKTHGCYGARLFFYRAEILGGRPKLRDDVSHSDLAWLSRDECETYLPRNVYKFAHQIIGAGPGEEFSRRMKWMSKIQGKGLTVDQATGRRAHRVTTSRLATLRLPAVATSKQATLASMPWSNAEKPTHLKDEMAALYKSQKEQQRRAKEIQVKLNIPSAATLAAMKRTANA